MIRKNKILFFLSVLVFLVIAITLICNVWIDKAAKGKTYTIAKDIPYKKTALLLGTSKFLKSGYINKYYSYRINATVELYKMHKFKYIIISGDNSTKEYNEPAMMKEDLVLKGIDSTRIFLDYAGFRTFDSVIRAREIFGQNSLTVISQKFHNERALFIADVEGIDAVAYNAQDVGSRSGLKVQVREMFARVKVFLDYLLGVDPKFLGEKIKVE